MVWKFGQECITTMCRNGPHVGYGMRVGLFLVVVFLASFFLFFCNNFSKLQPTQNFQPRKLLTCNSKNMLTLQMLNVFLLLKFWRVCFRWICEWRWRWAVHVRLVAGLVKTHLQLLPKYHVPYVYIYFLLSFCGPFPISLRVRWVTSLTCIWGMH